MLSLAKRVIRQIAGDKRTVALLVVAPMLIMTLVYLLLGDIDYTPTIAIEEENLPPALVSALKEQNADIINITQSGYDAIQYLKDNREVDAVFTASASGSNITMYEASSKGNAAMKAIQGAMASLNPSVQMHTDFVVGDPEESMFESLGFVFFGVISFFLIFIVSGMSLVRERTSGTLERMMMTPISRISVVGGYTLGFGLFAVIQSIVLVLFCVYVLGVHNEGNIAWVILIMLLLSVTAVSFGELISIFSNTELQVVQLIPIAIIPQIFFSGLIPLETIPYGLGNICYIMPVYYGCAAIKEILMLGHGLGDIWPFILALLACIIGLSALNTVALKRYRKL